ncbi:MAG: S41 family peptidase [Acutalibacteraceae bacterium]|nr:S41 family peptidase [Acutalibacteraceae bacterium]
MKNKKNVYPIVISALSGLIAGALCVLLFVPNPLRSMLLGSSAYAKMSEIEYIVKNNYYKDIDIDKTADYLAYGYMAGLDDDYATYLTKEEYEQEKYSNSGGGTGIGVTVCMDVDTGYIYVMSVSKDGPADKAGLKAGDLIYKIEDTKVNEDNYFDCVDMIRGEKGSNISLSLISGEDKKQVQVTRDDFIRQTVYYKMIENSCYIQITSFDEKTVEQFSEAIEYAQKKKADSLIFDLRDNSGGLVDSASEMLDMLLPEDVLMYAHYKDSLKVRAQSDKDEINLKMAVIVNENSASASEYFASAIRDFEKGKLIGNKTFGKGIMQTTFELSDSSAIRLTVATVTTKSKTQYHGVGLTPDVEVNYTQEQAETYYKLGNDDPYITKALKTVK